MNNIDSIIQSLRLIKKDIEQKQFVNQKLTNLYLNKDRGSLSLFLNNSELTKHIDISFKNGANFEHCYNMSINEQPNVLIELLMFLNKNNQMDKITSENINHCLLSSTLSRYQNVAQAEKKHIPLVLIYKTSILKDKISIDYADYAIFMNLSNKRNLYMTDFLLDNHYKEIINDKFLHKKLKSINQQDFSSYLMNKSLSLILKNNEINNLVIKNRKIKI